MNTNTASKIKLPDMNLTLVVTTMLRKNVYHFSRGDLGLQALNLWDNDPFTVDVQLTNRVPDPDGKMEDTDTPFGRRLTPVMKEVLVWRSTDTLPRWATAPSRARLRAEKAKEAHHELQ